MAPTPTQSNQGLLLVDVHGMIKKCHYTAEPADFSSFSLPPTYEDIISACLKTSIRTRLATNLNSLWKHRYACCVFVCVCMRAREKTKPFLLRKRWRAPIPTCCCPLLSSGGGDGAAVRHHGQHQVLRQFFLPRGAGQHACALTYRNDTVTHVTLQTLLWTRRNTHTHTCLKE